MKKIFFFLGIVLIGLSSCQYNIDKTNIYSVAKAIHESFVQKDTTILRQIFKHHMDSISNDQRDRIKEIQKFYNPKLKIIKIDTSSFLWFHVLDLFTKKGSNFYRIRANYERDSLGEISIDDLELSNINEECEHYKNTPYCPSSQIEFKSIRWTTDYYGKTFKSGEVTLKNNTGQDINYIKFRVILRNGNSYWNSKTFFNQTVESYKPSYKGDISTYRIPGMENYYAGFKIHKDNLYFNAVLIEVLPKPKSYWCNKLEELKKEVISKSE